MTNDVGFFSGDSAEANIKENIQEFYRGVDTKAQHVSDRFFLGEEYNGHRGNGLSLFCTV